MKTLTLDQKDVPDLNALEMVADGLARITGGGAVTVRSQIVVETENLPAYFMLQDLLTGKTGKRVAVREAAKAMQEPPRQKRPYTRRSRIAGISPESVPPAEPAVHEIRSWGVIPAGLFDLSSPQTVQPAEWITISEKNSRLAKGEFEPGTVLVHKGNLSKWHRVIGEKGSGQGMEPVEGGS
jgi:hypothetical protein